MAKVYQTGVFGVHSVGNAYYHALFIPAAGYPYPAIQGEGIAGSRHLLLAEDLSISRFTAFKLIMVKAGNAILYPGYILLFTHGNTIAFLRLGSYQ
jgi:hypothetical protein